MLDMGGTHDDDDLSFIRLAAVTANVVMWLKKKQTEPGNERAGEKKDDEKRNEQSRRYVERRIRDLREFERRARGE